MIFTQSVREFLTSKSNWTGLSTIAVGLYLLYIGEIQAAIQSVFGGLALIFVKDAIVKAGQQK